VTSQFASPSKLSSTLKHLSSSRLFSSNGAMCSLARAERCPSQHRLSTPSCSWVSSLRQFFVSSSSTHQVFKVFSALVLWNSGNSVSLDFLSRWCCSSGKNSENSCSDHRIGLTSSVSGEKYNFQAQKTNKLPLVYLTKLHSSFISVCVCACVCVHLSLLVLK